MIGSVMPKVCMKMRKNVTEKLRAEFPVTTRGYSVVKMTELDYTFSEFLNQQQAKGNVNHCSKKIKKEEERNGKK